MHRVGHAFIKTRMREIDALFAGEVSGHYYFRDFSYADTGLVPALRVMEMVCQAGRPLSELVAEFRDRYHISGEINSTVADVPGALQRLRERYSDGSQIEMDGLSVEFDDWHFNVRPSNTEPLLRLNLESTRSYEDMERRRDEVLEVIRS
jgi:phosphomannomutase